MYGKGSLAVPLRAFALWGLQLKQKIGDDLSVWIYPSQLCAIPMINDGQYTENKEGRPSAEEIAAIPHLFRLNIVELHETGVLQNVRDVRRYMVL